MMDSSNRTADHVDSKLHETALLILARRERALKSTLVASVVALFAGFVCLAIIIAPHNFLKRMSALKARMHVVSLAAQEYSHSHHNQYPLFLDPEFSQAILKAQHENEPDEHSAPPDQWVSVHTAPSREAALRLATLAEPGRVLYFVQKKNDQGANYFVLGKDTSGMLAPGSNADVMVLRERD
jgi:hypothetical protein